jgi:CubicO group peptidase (beta-lactamase class C family)
MADETSGPGAHTRVHGDETGAEGTETQAHGTETRGQGTETRVQGTVAEGFEPVREEFAAVIAEEATINEPGAQLAAYLNGRLVVDLWAGDGIDGDSLTGAFSSAKGAAHLVVAMLVQDGTLDLAREVARYWPEFAAEGKGALTLQQLMEHRAGVVGVDGGFSLEELADDAAIAARLAGQRPFWEPGTGYGYHALVIAALTGEVVRRVTGSTIQQLYEQRVRAPYGLDFYLGLPESLEPRFTGVRPMQPTAQQSAQLAQGPRDPLSLTGVAFNMNATPPTDLVTYANSRLVRAQGPASAGGIGSARGLAGMYAAAASELDGRSPLLTGETVARFGSLRTHGADLVTGSTDHFGIGFEAVSSKYGFVAPDALGHSGAAGSLGFADPRSGIAYGYTRRRFAFPGGAAPENERLAAAVTRAAAAVARG